MAGKFPRGMLVRIIVDLSDRKKAMCFNSNVRRALSFSLKVPEYARSQAPVKNPTSKLFIV